MKDSIEQYFMKSKASAQKIKLENNEKWIPILAAFRMMYNKTIQMYSKLQRNSILCPLDTTWVFYQHIHLHNHAEYFLKELKWKERKVMKAFLSDTLFLCITCLKYVYVWNLIKQAFMVLHKKKKKSQQRMMKWQLSLH